MSPHPDRHDPHALHDPHDECRTVRADGELDLTTAPDFTRGLEDVRHGSGRLFLVVDLSRVTFMDGSVLDPLCAAWDDCHERLGWARVVYTRPGIGLVFRAAAVQERFPRYATAQDARRGVAADPRKQYSVAGDLSA
ncbi:STAS domain-containing protein [Streptomyces sp. NBC_00038]|uniref:STAS domain-containing protein n=1 Tax=Streptomyces sp. NBC_00038 TaxID=2903615 RepID=UPI002251E98D|nr:STAS domain-containing protein [Streptomyces sp. NBC_00038]MCX5559220.1 STAS domain-containing protein [Streptomyces sp. NBC_00038]